MRAGQTGESGLPAGDDRSGPDIRSWSELMRGCASELQHRGIELQDELDLDDLIRQLEALRGRRIHLTPIRGPVGQTTLYGVTVSTREVDSIYFVDSHSEIQGVHAILHELAHLILGHRHASSDVGSPAEQQAEAMAAVLRGRWRDPAPVRWVVSRGLHDGLERVARAFAGPAAVVSAVLLAGAAAAGFAVRIDVLAPVMSAVSLLLMTAAATAVVAVSRSASDSMLASGIPALPLGAAVLLSDIVIVTQAGRSTPGAGGDRVLGWPAIVPVGVVTALWWTFAGALFLSAAWPYRGFLHLSRRVQLGVSTVAIGLCLGLLGGGVVIAAAVGALDSGASRAGGLAVLAGAALGSLGFLLPPAAQVLDPPRRGWRAWRSLRRIVRLRAMLRPGVPDWADELPRPRSWELLGSGRRLEMRLYQQIVAVRDLTWSLMAAVDLVAIDRAVANADRGCRERGEPAVAAAAEACWLADALRRTPVATTSPDVVIREAATAPRPTAGEGELEFLLDVERLWNGAIVRDHIRRLDEGAPDGVILG